MEKSKIKDIWDKLTTLSVLFASVLVPVVLAFVGHAYTNALKQAENRVKYTELAISILKEKPTDETKDVRAWAVDVINQYSGVPMSAQVKNQLIGSRLARSDLTASDFTESDFKMSNFRRSRFTGARFDESLFDGASFRDTLFGGADFRGADLSQVKIDEHTRLPR